MLSFRRGIFPLRTCRSRGGAFDRSAKKQKVEDAPKSGCERLLNHEKIAYHYDDRGSAPARGVGGGAGTEAEVHDQGPVYLYGLVYTHRTEPRRSMNKQ